MSGKPEIAVVIPLYDGAAWISEVLESVARQTLAPAETIVVDDGSSDEGLAIAAAVDGVSVIPGDQGGANQARNLGARRSSSEFLAFLDQDDLWSVEHLELLASLLAADPRHETAVALSVDFPHGSKPRFSRATSPVTSLDPWAVFPTNPVPTPSSVLIRRSAFERVGMWSLEYPRLADYLLWLRLTERAPMSSCSAITVGRRTHEESYSQQLKREGGAFAEHRDAWETAARYREEAGAAVPDRGRCSKLLETAEGALGAIEQRSVPRLEVFARGLEALTLGSRKGLTERVLGVLCWYSHPKTEDDEAYEWLLDAWPQGAERTYAALEFVVASQASPGAILHLLSKKPSSLSRWRISARLPQRALRRMSIHGTR